jgi:hypothetical protein
MGESAEAGILMRSEMKIVTVFCILELAAS